MLIILPMLVPIIIDNWGLHVLLRALVESSRDSYTVLYILFRPLEASVFKRSFLFVIFVRLFVFCLTCKTIKGFYPYHGI